MLTDEDIEKCREKATASYKLHYYSTRGQQVTAADDPEMHLIWEVIAACEAKLLEQEPVAVVVDSDSLESVISPAVAVGSELYLHPAPIPDGWQLVPVEPTDKMWFAGVVIKGDMAASYKAMLAAARSGNEQRNKDTNGDEQSSVSYALSRFDHCP